MKRNDLLKLATVLIAGSVCLSLAAFAPAGEGFSTSCFVTDKTGFGKTNFDNTKYSVTMRNTCEETQDVQIAIKRKDGNWSAGIGLGIAHGKTFTHSAYDATTEYRHRSRKAGNHNLVFPSEARIKAGE